MRLPAEESRGLGTGRDREARLGRARQRGAAAREASVEQDGGASPALGRQQQPPRRREPVMFGAPEFRQNRRSAEPQRLLEGPERRFGIAGADQDQPVGVDPMGRQGPGDKACRSRTPHDPRRSRPRAPDRRSGPPPRGRNPPPRRHPVPAGATTSCRAPRRSPPARAASSGRVPSPRLTRAVAHRTRRRGAPDRSPSIRATASRRRATSGIGWCVTARPRERDNGTHPATSPADRAKPPHVPVLFLIDSDSENGSQAETESPRVEVDVAFSRALSRSNGLWSTTYPQRIATARHSAPRESRAAMRFGECRNPLLQGKMRRSAMHIAASVGLADPLAIPPQDRSKILMTDATIGRADRFRPSRSRTGARRR